MESVLYNHILIFYHLENFKLNELKMRDLNGSYFLPHKYKRLGWAIISLSLLVVAIVGILYNNGFQNFGILEHILGPILSYATMIGLTIVISSREKKEDEMIRMIRLKSFQYGLYLTVVVSLLFFLLSIAGNNEFRLSSFIVAAKVGGSMSGINATLIFIVTIYQFKLFSLKSDEE